MCQSLPVLLLPPGLANLMGDLGSLSLIHNNGLDAVGSKDDVTVINDSKDDVMYVGDAAPASQPPSDVADTYATTLVAKLGTWFEYVSHVRTAAGTAGDTVAVQQQGTTQALKSHMVLVGRWLLEHCIIKGWAHVAKELMEGLMGGCGCSFRRLAHGSNGDGFTLLRKSRGVLGGTEGG